MNLNLRRVLLTVWWIEIDVVQENLLQRPSAPANRKNSIIAEPIQTLLHLPYISSDIFPYDYTETISI